MSKSIVAATEPYISQGRAKTKRYTRKHLRAINAAQRKRSEKKYGFTAATRPL